MGDPVCTVHSEESGPLTKIPLPYIHVHVIHQAPVHTCFVLPRMMRSDSYYAVSIRIVQGVEDEDLPFA